MDNLFERNQEATVYVGNLDPKVDEEILWELFTQCGPVVNIHLPKDKITNEHGGFGFVEFRTEEDADYSIKIMHMLKLFSKPIKVNKASQDKRTQEVGANLFIGNLDIDVDEKKLYDTFSVFGMILSTKIMKDTENGRSKGYGFISFDNFESSDSAINTMNGQYLSNKQISVQYAFKKDTKSGERHGSAAERLLAANRPQTVTTQRANKFEEVIQAQTLQMPNIPQIQQQQFSMYPPIPNVQGFPNQFMGQQQFQMTPSMMVQPPMGPPPIGFQQQMMPQGMGMPPPPGYQPPMQNYMNYPY